MEISTAHCFLFTVALFCINLPVRKSKESSPTRGTWLLSIEPLHAARSDSVKKCTCPVRKWCHLIVTPADRRNSCREKLTRFDHLRVREKSFLRQTSRTMRKISNWHLISSRAPQFRTAAVKLQVKLTNPADTLTHMPRRWSGERHVGVAHYVSTRPLTDDHFRLWFFPCIPVPSI